MNIYIVIQGQTGYLSGMLECFSGIPNVLWSTEDNTPSADIETIRINGIKPIVNPSVENGFNNINKQLHTSLCGIKEAIKLGADFIIKIRSDLTISDVPLFLDSLVTDGRINSLFYVDHNDIICPAPHEKQGTLTWLSQQFSGSIENLNKLNYLSDYFYYGPSENMLLLFEKCNRESIGSVVIPEIRIGASYLINNGAKIDFSPEAMKKHFNIIMDQMNKLNIRFVSLKHGSDFGSLHVQGISGRPRASLHTF
jgi:hypothetical protein